MTYKTVELNNNLQKLIRKNKLYVNENSTNGCAITGPNISKKQKSAVLQKNQNNKTQNI